MNIVNLENNYSKKSETYIVSAFHSYFLAMKFPINAQTSKIQCYLTKPARSLVEY